MNRWQVFKSGEAGFSVIVSAESCQVVAGGMLVFYNLRYASAYADGELIVQVYAPGEWSQVTFLDRS